jgi:hypothetical protein
MFAPDELIAALADAIVPAADAGNLDRLANVLRVIEAHNFGAGDFGHPPRGRARARRRDLRALHGRAVDPEGLRTQAAKRVGCSSWCGRWPASTTASSGTDTRDELALEGTNFRF